MTKNINDSPQREKLSFVQIFKSALFAMLGVQSKEIHERDFASGEIIKFIIVGIFLTFLFVISLFFVVSLIV